MTDSEKRLLRQQIMKQMDVYIDRMDQTSFRADALQKLDAFLNDLEALDIEFEEIEADHVRGDYPNGEEDYQSEEV